MNKRQKEVQQVYLDNEKETLERLKKNYGDALGRINEKLEQLTARQDARMQYVIYQIEYQKALKEQIETILTDLQAEEFETISEYLTRSYEDGFIGTMYDLQGQGIPLVFPIDQEQVVSAVQLESRISENLYTRLGRDIGKLQIVISEEISRGISTNRMYGEMARSISEYGNIPMNNAMRIARTEAHRIQNRAAEHALFKAKDKGADVVKQWDSTLDDRTRESHMQLDGQIRELDKPFEVNGKKAMYPGGFGDPSEDCNCRCCMLQRAKWALGNDYTKWSEDAPVMVSDDGTTQFVKIQAKSYNTFKEQYQNIIDTYIPAETLDEARKYAKDVLGVEYDSFSTRKMNLDVANEINRTILQYQKEFSKNGISLSNIMEISKRTRWCAAYNRGYRAMLLKSVDSKNALKNMEKDAQRNKSSGWWSTGDSMTAIRHELGHAVDQAIGTEEKREAVSKIRKDILNKINADETIFIDYLKAGKTLQECLDATSQAGEYISGYALTSDGEMIAESVAEYMAGNPRETARQVVEILKGDV